MITGALFDMDGLMLDTERIGKDGWMMVGKVYNYPIDEEFFFHIVGTNQAFIRDYFYSCFGKAVAYETARQVRVDYMESYIKEHGVPVKKGLVELLSFLKEQNIPCCVATSTNKEQAERYLKMAGVYDYFTAYIYGDMVQKSKPEPDIFLTAAKLLHKNPAECAVLEDSKNGVKAGAAAGCKVIAVPDVVPLDEVLPLTSACCADLLEAMEYIKRENGLI